MKIFMCLILAVAFLAFLLVACSSTRSSTAATALESGINAIASAVSTAVTNGTATQTVAALASAGVIDSASAAEIEAIIPVAGTLASTVSTATATDSGSKHVKDVFDQAAFQATVVEILKAHSASINAEKAKNLKGILK